MARERHAEAERERAGEERLARRERLEAAEHAVQQERLEREAALRREREREGTTFVSSSNGGSFEDFQRERESRQRALALAAGTGSESAPARQQTRMPRSIPQVRHCCQSIQYHKFITEGTMRQ